MTPAEQQASYEARGQAVNLAIEALPPKQQAFVLRWRRLVEQAGRLSQQGCALSAMEGFVRDVQESLVKDTGKGW